MSYNSAISIHALREEGDLHGHLLFLRPKSFLSTPSARRATLLFQVPCIPLLISIHALREEGDVQRQYVYQELRNFYPRPPRGGRHVDTFVENLLNCYFYPRPPRGGRRIDPDIAARINPFLSTPSARRATAHRWECTIRQQISIHALREEGDTLRREINHGKEISIHALREEGDRRQSSY